MISLIIFYYISTRNFQKKSECNLKNPKYINYINLQISAVQWKLLGQEKDGSLLLTWIEQISTENGITPRSTVGHYDRINNKLQVNTN